jgi:hypothetical protein
LDTLLTRGLTATAAAWPALRLAYGWVQQAAHLLGQAEERGVELRRRDYRALLAEMSRRRAEVDDLAPAIAHFLKVTKSYWPGLFHCYEVPDLPRTNNDLEHFFGSARYQERRTTGRKFAAPSTVVRGAVRLVAAVATRLKPFSAAELRPTQLPAWHQLRRDLAQRHEARRAQYRFRRAPEAYLAQAEALLLKPALPP